MKWIALRSILMWGVVAAALMIGSITPVAAASKPPIEAALAIVKPLECYWNGDAYPLGSRIPALYGAYWQCELVARVDYSGPAWVFHND